MNEIFISLKDIYKTYGKKPDAVNALSDISLTLNRGDSAVVTGPSGSGKTTLLNLIGGLDTPDSGTLRIGSLKLNRMGEKERTFYRRKHVGFIFQDDALIPELTAFENIELPLVLTGCGRKKRIEKVESVLSSLGISLKKNSFPYELSGGEKQRVAAARAVVHDPAIVLADEPTSNLDRSSSDKVIDVIRSISKNLGITVLISSHDQEVISRFDKKITLNYGKIMPD